MIDTNSMGSVSEQQIIVRQHDKIIEVTFNRPNVLNALNESMSEELRRVGRDLQENDSACVVVLKGSGGGFMAGGDVAMFKEHIDDAPALIRRIIPNFHEFIRSIREMNKIVIAQVHGVAAGGGLSVMLACDLVAIADDAKLAWAYGDLATTPDGGGSWFLSHSVGEKKALELLLLEKSFSAKTAHELGLANWIVPSGELECFVQKIASRLSTTALRATIKSKLLVQAARQGDLSAHLEREFQSFVDCSATPDFVEGVMAFMDRRRPNFS